MTRIRFERFVVPGVLAAVALTLYLLTLSDVHTYDALSYIRDVDGRTGFFFHPHHLLYSPTGWLFWQSWRLVGYGGNSELPLKVLNALVGAACGFGLYQLTYGLTRYVVASSAAAGAFLFAYANWYFAVEVEVYLLAVAWLLPALALLVELVTAPRARTAPLLGLAVAGASIYHQTNGLMAGVVIAAVLLAPMTARDKLRSLLISGLVAGGVVALAYAVVGFGINGYRTLGELRDWMFFFVQTGWWGHATRDRWTDLGAGLGNTISTRGALPYWIGLVALLVLGGVAARRRPRVVLVCVAWILIYGSFFAWWEGDNIEFWIASLLPLWLLLGLAVAEIRPKGLRHAASAVAMLGVVSLAWHNYPIVRLRGDASVDLQRHLSAGIRNVTTAEDLVFEPGGVLELYLPYYEGRPNVRTLNGVLFETGGDIDRALERVSEYVSTSLHAGLAVVVGRNAMELPEDVFQRFDVPQERLEVFWRPYRPAMAPAVVHENKTYFYRIPPAQELVESGGWRWTSFDWGWQAANVANSSFAEAWCFDPQPDPMLLSPLLRLDARSARAVEITLSTAAQGQTAQLFYAGQDGGLSDERSVQWAVEGDGAPHTYTIPLEGAPGWGGTISRLRLDPIAVGDGTSATRTCVHGLRFVR